jgi:putative ABC transport system permease protein
MSMTILSLTLRSISNRKFNTLLVTLSMALSIALLIGVDRIRIESLNGFTRSVSGTDLIVGARSGSVNLLLFSIFHVGNPSNNISLAAHDHLIEMQGVAWSIPIVLGDNHRGYPVIGTTEAYLEHFRYGAGHPLHLASGRWFGKSAEAVLGADVAKALKYKLGDEIVIAHGGGDVSFMEHDDHPVKVAGILAPTGTPIDRTIHMDLSGIDVMHQELNAAEQGYDPLLMWAEPIDADHEEKGHPEHEHHGLNYKGELSAVLLGLKSRAAAVFLQRSINQYKNEALSAIMPGVALQELWSIMDYLEKGLLAISAFVIVIGLIGMLIALMTTLDQRRREMAILRSVGARPGHVLGLIVSEAALITTVAIMLGFSIVYLLLAIAQPILQAQAGLFIEIGWPTVREMTLISFVALAGIIVSLVPAYRIYRYSLSDGITIRL